MRHEHGVSVANRENAGWSPHHAESHLTAGLVEAPSRRGTRTWKPPGPAPPLWPATRRDGGCLYRYAFTEGLICGDPVAPPWWKRWNLRLRRGA